MDRRNGVSSNRTEKFILDNFSFQELVGSYDLNISKYTLASLFRKITNNNYYDISIGFAHFIGKIISFKKEELGIDPNIDFTYDMIQSNNNRQNNIGGGKNKKQKKPKVYTGKRGGKYIIKNNKKRYIK